jgi:hypothetical protein
LFRKAFHFSLVNLLAEIIQAAPQGTTPIKGGERIDA